MPSRKIASAGLAVRPFGAAQGGTALKNLAAAFRALSLPVIGRIQDGIFIMDFRCLEDESAFSANCDSRQPLPRPFRAHCGLRRFRNRGIYSNGRQGGNPAAPGSLPGIVGIIRRY